MLGLCGGGVAAAAAPAPAIVPESPILYYSNTLKTLKNEV